MSDALPVATDRHGSCVVCAKRDPHRGYVCDSDRSRLRTWLREIPELLVELGAEERPLRDRRPYVRADVDEEGVEHRTVTARPADPVGYHLAGAAVPGPGRGGRVSGSRERPLPIRTDAHDLAMPARVLPGYDEDQVGQLPVAAVLDGWVRDWRAHRSRGERLPVPTVPILAGWLLDRLDEACDDHPAVGEFTGQVRATHAALRAQLGLIEVPDYKAGVPCRECNGLTLYRSNGSDFVECGSCPSLLGPEEYARWTGLVAVAAREQQRGRKAGVTPGS